MTLGRLLRIVRQRVRALSRPDRLDADTTRELAFHLEQLAREKEVAGLSREAAGRAAHRAFGNPTALGELCRETRRVSWLLDLRQDLTYGLRTLRRQPGFAGTAVASLALAIGANGAIVATIGRVLVDQLPFEHADRLVVVHGAVGRPGTGGLATAQYLAWRAGATSVAQSGLSLPWIADFGESDHGAPPERLLGQTFTPSLFQTLGVPPLLGRTFTEAEGVLGPAARVVVISYGLWQRRFGGNPAILGTPLHIDLLDRTVIGVMPESFRFQDSRVDFWLPLIVGRGTASPSPLFTLVARLRTGVDAERARAELDAIDAHLPPSGTPTAPLQPVSVTPIRQVVYGWTIRPLLTLQTAVGLLLVIACANLTALLLVRGASRAPEIRLRLALGASRARIGRQLLAESLLIGLAGGLAGIGVTWIGLRAMARGMLPPLGAPRLPDLALWPETLVVTIGLAVLSVAAFGLTPAFVIVRRAAPGEPAVPHRSARRPRLIGLLVAGEVAAASILLVSAGLLTRSLMHLEHRDLGFDPTGLVTADFRALGPYGRQAGVRDGRAFFDVNPAPRHRFEEILERLRAVPGVEAAAGTSRPLLDALAVTYVPVELPERADVAYAFVTPGFFGTVRAARLRGRDLTGGDTTEAAWVAVVNETAAHLLWPGRDALGQHLTLGAGPGERAREVVGVVADLALQHTQVDAVPMVYSSYLQEPPLASATALAMFGQMTFVLRHAGDPAGVVPAARRAVALIAPDRPLSDVTVTAAPTQDLQERRIYAITMTVFASVAVLLAMMGVFALVSRSVGDHLRELGIRRALGAESSQIASIVVRHWFALMAGGLAVGLTAALVLTRLMASQLWQVAPADPGVYALSATVLLAAGASACIGPARRALAVDPATILRTES